jgi:hypothetical protein
MNRIKYIHVHITVQYVVALLMCNFSLVSYALHTAFVRTLWYNAMILCFTYFNTVCGHIHVYLFIYLQITAVMYNMKHMTYVCTVCTVCMQ